MPGETEVWLGDLVRAIDALKPADPFTGQAIARALGFRVTAADRGLQMEDPSPAPEPLEPSPATVVSEPTTPAAPLTDSVPPRLLTPVETASGGARPWEQASELSTLPQDAGPLPHRSLFAPTLERQLLIALAAEFRFDGEIDTATLVKDVSHGAAVRAIPQLPRRHLAREVQALVDLGAAMEPFAHDRSALLVRLAQVLGETRVTAIQFRDLPLRASGPGPVWTWQPYVPPAPGATVLAVTSLGAASPRRGPSTERRVGEWIAVASLLKSRGSSFIALVPHPAQRTPARLRRAFPVITWDRTTRVAEITKAVRQLTACAR
ncbi:MAG: hypothetical protein ACLP01_07150 [Solirubrobacteraceae bacterium]